MKYRKRPVVIEAIQYNGENGNEIKCWSGNIVRESPVLDPSKDNPDGSYVQIKTLEGVMTGINGDWIIKGVNGEFYPCKPDIFQKTYESASLPSSSVTGESEAIGFAEWHENKYLRHGETGLWHTYDDWPQKTNPVTTLELYNLYKQSKK